MNTDVPGSPESCRATADALDRLARQLEYAGRLAGRGARTPGGDFDGRSADAYRAACAGLAADASARATTAHRSAGALASYAEDLAEVQRVMERVRGSASVHGLLQGAELVAPAAPSPHQRRVFDRLSAIAADAFVHLERARDRLSAAFPGEPFPAGYGNVLRPPADEPVGPLAFPPPESAWPAERRDDAPRQEPHREDRPQRDDQRAGPDRGTARDAAPEEPPAPHDAGHADDADADVPGVPERDAPPPPEPRFHWGGPVGGGDPGDTGYGDSDRARLPGHVLRPAPEPVP